MALLGFVLAAGLLALALAGSIYFLFFMKSEKTEEQQRRRPPNRPAPGRVRRRRRARQREETREASTDEEDLSDEDFLYEEEEEEEPISRRQQRISAYEEKIRAREVQREAQEAAEAEERLRKAEERRKKDEEEAQKWAEFITVEDKGETETVDEHDLLASFVTAIKDRKAVVLEDLAIEFGMKTQDVIQRIKELEGRGDVTGIMDDRGKYLYLSEEEMKNVAAYIVSKGRVSIRDVASESHRLIDLMGSSQ